MSEVERIGVVGAGTMGAGIAQVAALGGYETRLHDPVPAALDKGVERLRAALAKGAGKGLWAEEDAETANDRVGAARHLRDLGECNLVIEAAPEDLSLKRELFSSLAEAWGDGAIAVVLTGTGKDGADGVRAIKDHGGTVIAQDEASSDYFGMPNAAFQTGVVDRVVSLDGIASVLIDLTGGSV